MMYVASRVHHYEMWKEYQRRGCPIISSWIDEAGPGMTPDMGVLWSRIETEISVCDTLVMYVHKRDLPLKGALVEAGMAIAMGKRVHVVLDEIKLERPSMRPIGSWVKHHLVRLHPVGWKLEEVMVKYRDESYKRNGLDVSAIRAR